jgi:hypothetical protein
MIQGEFYMEPHKIILRPGRHPILDDLIPEKYEAGSTRYICPIIYKNIIDNLEVYPRVFSSGLGVLVYGGTFGLLYIKPAVKHG